jgi:putative membrane protein
MRIIFTILANALALLATAYLIPGIHIENFIAAVVAALVLGLLNAFLKPILFLLTLPVNLFTFGLFSWIISAFLLWFAARIVPGFTIDGFLPALVGGIILAFVSSLLQTLVVRK